MSSSELALSTRPGLLADLLPGCPSAPAVVMRARDGSVLWWGDAETPGPPPLISPGATVSIAVAVSPVRPGHAVTVEYRVNGGPVQQAIALPELRSFDANARIFRAVLPGQPAGQVEYLPVLRFAGQPVSPCLEDSAEPSRYRVGRTAPPVAAPALPAAPSSFMALPLWGWNTEFLGSVTATLRKEIVGATPDGLRIDWPVKEGRFTGPDLDCVMLPSAADWMRIREDGVGIISVQACFEARTGIRIYCSYAGILDLGLDGYARALRDEFPPLPPVVVTPTFVTADKQLEWLNRAQCVGLGRVDMAALQIEFDIYRVQVGGRKHAK